MSQSKSVNGTKVDKSNANKTYYTGTRSYPADSARNVRLANKIGSYNISNPRGYEK